MANVCHTGAMSRRGWVVWAVGVVAYILAVMQRTTFAIRGLDAAERFAITPGVLSTFVFVQVAVYLAAQVPAGIAVDRFGSRAMLVVSGVVLAAGQLLLAVAPDLVTAVLARVVVGLGDALVFTAVLALVPRWVPAGGGAPGGPGGAGVFPPRGGGSPPAVRRGVGGAGGGAAGRG